MSCGWIKTAPCSPVRLTVVSHAVLAQRLAPCLFEPAAHSMGASAVAGACSCCAVPLRLPTASMWARLLCSYEKLSFSFLFLLIVKVKHHPSRWRWHNLNISMLAGGSDRGWDNGWSCWRRGCFQCFCDMGCNYEPPWIFKRSLSGINVYNTKYMNWDMTYGAWGFSKHLCL